jgi:hypothetical protein
MNKLAGLTRADCAVGCTASGCVIADGRPHCMHPCKSGVPSTFKDDPTIQKLYADACGALGIQNKHLVTQ